VEQAARLVRLVTSVGSNARCGRSATTLVNANPVGRGLVRGQLRRFTPKKSKQYVDSRARCSRSAQNVVEDLSHIDETSVHAVVTSTVARQPHTVSGFRCLVSIALSSVSCPWVRGHQELAGPSWPTQELHKSVLRHERNYSRTPVFTSGHVVG
jgi:hypothetical protein